MKKRKIIILSILIIVLLAGVFAITHYWDYIQAFIYTIRYSDEEIQQKIDENNKKIEDALKEHTDVVIREPTKEELDELSSGKITEDQLAEKIAEEGSKGNVPGGEPPKTSTPTENSKPTENFDDLIAAKVAKMYVLKSYYLGQLSGLEQKIIDDYNALPENKKNLSGKKDLISKYLGIASSLESECDKKVDTLLSELKVILKKADKDLSLVDNIKSAYNNEKSLKKAYYFEMLNN